MKLLNDLVDINKIDFSELLITKKDAEKLQNYTFVDFRDRSKYDKDHIKGARYIDYSDMFSKPMMEELNKSNSLIIVHDTQAVAGVIAGTLKLMDYPDIYILK